MRLLFISSQLLFRGTRFGGAKRLYYFAREWERTARLTLVCLDGCREWDAAAAGEPEFRDILRLPDPGAPGPWDRVFRAPADRRAAFAADGPRLREFLKGKTFDAVLLAYPWALSFLDGPADLPDCPVTYLEDDLVFEQFRQGAAAGPAPRRLLQGIRLRQTLAYYRGRLAGVDRFVAISPQEADIVSARFPGLPVEMIKYALPLDEYPMLPPPGDPCAIGFIGNYGHLPNLDALRWLSDEVMPAVRRRRPDARFVVGGRGIPPWFRARHGSDPDVAIRESVPDLADFYAGIAVFLNPIRAGRGLRTKVLEAAAFGRPVVTTALGAEGFEDLDLAVAEGAEGLAAACAAALERGSPEAVASNRRRVESDYALAPVAAGFLARLGRPRTARREAAKA